MTLGTSRQCAAVVKVIVRGQLSRYGGGNKVGQTTKFEQETANHFGVERVRAVNSGTSALMCGLVGLGVGPGDEVLVPAYTWISSAAAVFGVGAVPVLVEVDDSLMMDPHDMASKITDQTAAVMPVHMLNHVCDLDEIANNLRERQIPIIEDACQAIGVTYRGRHVGSIGAVGAFSFNDNKNLRSGEGGVVLCNDATVFARASMFHDVGSYMRSDRVESAEPWLIGMNLKMSELTAAILRSQIPDLDKQIQRRKERRTMMMDELSGVPGLRFVPHHDPTAAAGLAVSFDDPAQAERFGSGQAADYLWHTARHIYTNWDSLRGGRSFHPGFDPYGWSNNRVPGADECPRTLDVLKRTCNVRTAPNVPIPVLRRLARKLANS